VEDRFTTGSWPARLLHLEGGQDIRLVEMSGPPETYYAALSYCWGSNWALHDTYKTTENNLKNKLECIPFELLPKTIRHAVVITRQLGIKYLWVDALCIIQDSKADWGKEAAKMGTIYSKAIVTIAAETGSSCDSGMLAEENKEPEPEEMEEGEGEGEGKTETFFEDTSTTETVVSGNSAGDDDDEIFWIQADSLYLTEGEIEQDLNDAPLQTRGWTFQERMLSARIIHFCAYSIFWECRQCFADKSRLLASDGTMAEKTVPGLATTIHAAKKGVSIPSEESGDAARQWPTIARWYMIVIKEYSRRVLSYATDRFPAISAVARLVQSQTRSEYLAGLWLTNLHCGLFWISIGPAVRSPQAYIAPSFSWAACQNPVRWLTATMADPSKAMFTVDSYECKLAPPSLDPFGSLASGWLRLTGQIFNAAVRPYDGEYFDSMTFELMPNVILVDKCGKDIGHAYMEDIPVFPSPAEEIMVTCFFLTRLTLSSHEKQLDCILVLSPVDGAAGMEGSYRRTGAGTLSESEWTPASLTLL